MYTAFSPLNRPLALLLSISIQLPPLSPASHISHSRTDLSRDLSAAKDKQSVSAQVASFEISTRPLDFHYFQALHHFRAVSSLVPTCRPILRLIRPPAWHYLRLRPTEQHQQCLEVGSRTAMLWPRQSRTIWESLERDLALNLGVVQRHRPRPRYRRQPEADQQPAVVRRCSRCGQS